ncbi:hypothetical protein [Exiguobacterium sp. SH1S21]|uniref:hypothetical protein n=1 Tax=Exiguobacterium sp. SH1S21 TaxID=2510953 RepID=UPI001F36AA86|nr:hypothetical protein [Exiguobacterium sp. SH1S21]
MRWLSMGGYVNMYEIGLFLFIGLLFMAVNIFLMSRRLIRTRYAMLSILASSVWPALMIVLSVQNVNLLEELRTRTVTLEAVFAWSLVVTTALMTVIPAFIFIRRLIQLSRHGD